MTARRFQTGWETSDIPGLPSGASVERFSLNFCLLQNTVIVFLLLSRPGAALRKRLSNPRVFCVWVQFRFYENCDTVKHDLLVAKKLELRKKCCCVLLQNGNLICSPRPVVESRHFGNWILTTKAMYGH